MRRRYFMGFPRRLVISAVALVAFGCGGSADVAVETAVQSDPAFSPPSDGLAATSTVVPEPTQTTAPAESEQSPTSSALTAPGSLSAALPQGSICDWLYSASFTSTDASVRYDHNSVDVTADDWVDLAGVSCVEDRLVATEDSYDYNLSFHIENDVLMIESDSGEFGSSIPATSYLTWDQAASQEPWRVGYESAGVIGMTVVQSYLDGDRLTFESLLAPEVMFIDDLGLSTKDAIVASNDAESFPAGHDYSSLELRDYLVAYKTAVKPVADALDAERVEAFENFLPDAELVVFVGQDLKADRRPLLFDDLLRLVLSNDGTGWRIVGL